MDKIKLEYFPFGYYSDCSDLGWILFYTYFNQIGIEMVPDFTKYSNLFLEALPFMTLQFKNMCLISRPPIKIYRDPQNRLHAIDRPAILFIDGYALYFVHGISFTFQDFDQFILHDPDFSDVLALPNVEQRTVIFMEKKELLFQNDGVHLLSKDREWCENKSKYLTRELYSFTYEHDTHHAILLHDHSVEKPNIHIVPTTCHTPKEAVDWMNHGLTEFKVQT